MTDKIATNLLPPDIVLSALTHEQESFPLAKENIREFTDGEKQAFVSRMGEYFGKIPGLKISDQTMKSLCATYSKRIPVCFVRIAFLFETRKAKKTESPYRNDNVPPRATITTDNIDQWSYHFDEHNEYSDRSSEIIVFESKDIFDCPKCNAHGTLRCGKCNGQGRHTCEWCNGTTVNTCMTCMGRGTVSETIEVNRGGGPVWDSITKTCIKCQGTGKTTCSRCGRSGVEQCGYCGGRGEVQCSRCEGRGQLLRYVVVTQNLTAKQKSGFITLSDIPTNIFSSLAESDVTPIARWEGNCQVAEMAQFLSENFTDSIVSSELEAWFTELSKGIVAGFQIKQMEIIVSKAIVNHVHYEMDGMKYDTWLYGKKQNIFSLTNPVVDHVRQLLIQAIQQWREGNVAESTKLYKNAKMTLKREKSCNIAFQEAAPVLPKRLAKS